MLATLVACRLYAADATNVTGDDATNVTAAMRLMRLYSTMQLAVQLDAADAILSID
jgi:hypothetical protein